MQQWLQANWGNVASVFGLLFSVFAIWQARSARNAIKAFRERQRELSFLRALELALHDVREISQSKSRKWPFGKCDSVREKLAEWQDDSLFTEAERERIKLAIAEFSTSRDNDDDGKRWLRGFSADLATAKRRLLDRIEESLK